MKEFAVAGAVLAVLTTTLACQSGSAQEELSTAQYRADFDYMWTQLRDRYAYFTSKKIDWNTVRTLYRPRLDRVTSRSDFVRLLEEVLEELYDSHTHLQTHLADSPNIVPSRADLWAQWIGGKALITAVRPGFVADLEGVRAGMEVVAVDGVEVGEAVRQRLPKALRSADPAARNYALRKVVAGRRGADRRLRLRQNGQMRTFTLAQGRYDSLYQDNYQGRLEQQLLAGGWGYINIVNALGDSELVPLFDAALATLAHTPGLIVDLRQTPNGGDFAILQGLMGRFIATEQVAHRNFPLGGTPYFSTVRPRGPWRYERPLVLLVGRWTASAGEGMASSLDHMGVATVVGTPMGGLEGSVFSATMPHSGIRFQSVDTRILNGTLQEAGNSHSFTGTNRAQYRPGVLVDLAASRYAGVEDPVLDEGIRALQRLIRY
ncbi:MAG: hypothetical protein GKR89_22510 [Candidatus Latescibacteria bacterium]|nr:hypothetical protein [Candidatus Latescibacterota bacterium]